MKKLLSEKPWLLIVALFVVLIAAWTVLIYIAQTNQPEKVPLETPGGVVTEEKSET